MKCSGIDLSEAPRDCTVVWDDVRAWITGRNPPLLTDIPDTTVRTHYPFIPMLLL